MIKLFVLRNHLISRFLSIPAGGFLVFLIISFGRGREEFTFFVQSWKFMTGLSFVIIIFHTALEIKTALEDYISNIKYRERAIKTVFIGACFMSLVICFFIARV